MTILAALIAIVCSINSSRAADEQHEIDRAQLKVGSHVEIVTKETVSGSKRTSTIFLGTVKTVTGESVTLHDVSKTIRSEDSTPILRSVPYVNRYFRNVGIGRTHMGKRTVVIPLADIARSESVTPVEFRKRSEVPIKMGVRVQKQSAP
jgi:hypothetical protein